MILPPAPPNFQPYDPHRPVKVYRRNLPHWRQQGATYFLTFHTRDSLPKHALKELQQTRENWLRLHPPPHDDVRLFELDRLIMKHTEQWLHSGEGSCPFQHLEHRQCLHQALLHFHGHEKADDETTKNENKKRVELGAFVIMPNHAHVVVRPLRSIKLENWAGTVKQYVGKRTPATFKLDGQLWPRESHDRLVRNLGHLNKCVRYIGKNPGMSELSGQATETLWLNPDWKALGWSLGAGVGV